MICIPDKYCVFQTIRRTPPPIWEENGDLSYSLNVAYLAHLGERAAVEWGFFFSYFPLKPRYVLWSGVSYSLKNTVNAISITAT